MDELLRDALRNGPTRWREVNQVTPSQQSLMIRYTPTLTFELDTSIENGVRLTQLIDAANRPAKP